MPTEMILQQSPGDAALLEGRERLARVRTGLADRESEVAHIRAQMKVFEGQYLSRVGLLYAELDDVEARIAEREVDLYDSDSSRRRAREARQRAEETRDAASSSLAQEPEEIGAADSPPSLKMLFREVAKRIHPDFAGDDAEQTHFTLLMARANEAYRRGDMETLQRLLDDYSEVRASLAEEGPASELLRITRQIRHAERDLAVLAAEEDALLASELGQLHRDAEAAAREDRDLLTELARTLQEQIADARHRFELVDRQIGAHGR